MMPLRRTVGGRVTGVTGRSDHAILALRQQLEALERDGVEAAHDLRALENTLRRRATTRAQLTDLMHEYRPVIAELRARMDAAEPVEQRLYELLRQQDHGARARAMMRGARFFLDSDRRS